MLLGEEWSTVSGRLAPRVHVERLSGRIAKVVREGSPQSLC